MMRYWLDGRMFGINTGTIITIFLIIAVIYILKAEQGKNENKEDPMKILDERLAKGEITEEEYRNLKYLLTRKED